jgi:hypothetical protein
MVYESRHWQKLIAREVNAATLGEVIPAFLKWSKTAITFDKKDHPTTFRNQDASSLLST